MKFVAKVRTKGKFNKAERVSFPTLSAKTEEEKKIVRNV